MPLKAGAALSAWPASKIGGPYAWIPLDISGAPKILAAASCSFLFL